MYLAYTSRSLAITYGSQGTDSSRNLKNHGGIQLAGLFTDRFHTQHRTTCLGGLDLPASINNKDNPAPQALPQVNP